MIELNNENLNEIIENNSTIIIDFYAKWCGPCRMLEPIFENVSKKHKDMTFIRIDIDKHEEITNKYRIMSVPTIVIIKEKKEVKRNSGFISEEAIEDLIKQ